MRPDELRTGRPPWARMIVEAFGPGARYVVGSGSEGAPMSELWRHTSRRRPASGTLPTRLLGTFRLAVDDECLDVAL